MKILLFGFVFISSLSSAADIIQYDPKTTFCLAYYTLVDEFKFMDDKGFPLPGYMIFTDKSAMTNKELASIIGTIPIYHLKKKGDPGVEEMTQAEKDSVDGKIQDDQAKTLGSQYKDFIENNLAIQTMIEEFAKVSGADPVVLRDTIEQSIATKLGLPSL